MNHHSYKTRFDLRVIRLSLATCAVLAIPLAALPFPALAGSTGKKAPVPAGTALADAAKTVKELYGAEYAKAESLEAKRALAVTLLDKAREVHDDLPGRFVLLRYARDVATQALDGLLAFQVIDAMSDTFEIDPVEMKATVLKKGSLAAKEPQHHKAIMQYALKYVDEAVAEDNYAVARQLCDLAAAEATAAHLSEAALEAKQRGDEVDRALVPLYEKAQTATAQLKADPVNPQANAAVGKYLCFVKGDWDAGVLMLALGDDPTLKEIAAKELDELTPPKPEDLADRWWDLSEKQSEMMKSRMRARAATWYRKALPELSGLARAKAEKRMEPPPEFIADSEPASPREQPQPTPSPKPIKRPPVQPAAGYDLVWQDESGKYLEARFISAKGAAKLLIRAHGFREIAQVIPVFEAVTPQLIKKVHEKSKRNYSERKHEDHKDGDVIVRQILLGG